MSYLDELKRRNVIRSIAAYLALSWLIIQVAETVMPLFELGAGAVRAVVIVLAVGIVPVAALAWSFELTPAGIQRDRNVDRNAPGMRELGRRLDRVFLLVLAIAVGYFAIDKFVLDPARDRTREEVAEQRGRSSALLESYGIKSIAVLPFVNMSSDPEQEYFSDGIAEEVLNLLTRITELRVISRSSSFTFKGQDLPMPEIAGQLNVAHILEGSVRKSGNRIRVTAQLIEAATDTHLWSQTYDRELDDIFAIQDEIAADVVANLELTLLGGVPTGRRTDPEAYRLTLQARSILQGPGPRDLDQIIGMLERALQLDPSYVPAMLDLVVAHYWRADRGDGPGDREERAESTRTRHELVRRALAVEPDNGVAHAYLGWNYFADDRELQKAADEIELAVSLEPGNSEVLRGAAGFARRIGRSDTAIRLAQLSLERDPLCFICAAQIWSIYLEAGRFAEAIEVRRTFSWGDAGAYTEAFAHLLSGAAEESLEMVESGAISEQEQDMFRAMALHDLDRPEEAQAALGELIKHWGEEYPVGVATAQAWIGEEEAALDWLYARYWPHTERFFAEVFNPVWIRLHDNIRWQALLEQSGMTTERLAAIRFEPVLVGE
jgi:adenylate cyclase